MPSTIPYDPSLVLGSIVQTDKLSNLEKIGKAQAPADAAQTELNSLISLKRSIEMTVQELVGLGIDVSDVITKSEETNIKITKAASNYIDLKLASEIQIQPLRALITDINDEVESPIDYNRSIIKKMPISADSLQMDVQYFNNDENDQSSYSHAGTIASYVSESLSIFGDKQASQASASAQNQVNSQTTRHDIAGTLVLSITCTHKNAQIFAPFILDVDKAVRAWNTLFPDKLIKTNDATSIAKIEAAQETKNTPSFQVLSGATYGSSFVGMVHILNSTNTTSMQNMESIAASMQETFDIGGWFASGTGGFGVSSSFSDSAKNLLSTQTIQSHCSLITMGIIPSIKSNTVKIGVKQFSDFDPAKQMEELATLQGATAEDNNTISSSADAARTGQQMVTLKNSTIKSALSGLADIDDGANNIIDINSVMTAMDDYIQKCIEGGDNLGVPINYFLKPITQAMIARSWLAKYYPNKFQAGSSDDSKTNGDNPDGDAK